MSYVHHRVMAGIGEAAQKLARIGITLAPLEKATEPARHAAFHGEFGVGMKARDRTTALRGMAIEFAQHPSILVPFAAAAVGT
jgi:hypothetical protein